VNPRPDVEREPPDRRQRPEQRHVVERDDAAVAPAAPPTERARELQDGMAPAVVAAGQLKGLRPWVGRARPPAAWTSDRDRVSPSLRDRDLHANGRTRSPDDWFHPEGRGCGDSRLRDARPKRRRRSERQQDEGCAERYRSRVTRTPPSSAVHSSSCTTVPEQLD
jgi:hypothetical protein